MGHQDLTRLLIRGFDVATSLLFPMNQQAKGIIN